MPVLVVAGRGRYRASRLMMVAPADSATAVLASLLQQRRRALRPTCLRLAYVMNRVSREMSPGVEQEG